MADRMTAFNRLMGKVAQEPHPSVTPPGVPPTHVTGGYGVVPGAKHAVNPNVPVPVQKITQRDAQNLMNAEILQALHDLVMSTTELTSQINRGGSLNGVLRVGAYVLTADPLELNHPVTVGSARITNLSTVNTLTVQIGAGAAGATPGIGQGFQLVNPGVTLSMPIGAKAFVIYGTAADRVNVQAYTGLQALGVSR